MKPRLRINDSRKQTALYQVTVFSLANYLAELFFFLRGFFLARILGPEIFGVWAQMKLTLNGSRHGSLGANDAMQREVPYLVGKQRQRDAGEVEAAAAGVNLFTGAVLGLAIASAVWLWGDRLSWQIRSAWLILSIAFPVRQMLWYVRSRLRATKRFNLLSIVMMTLAFSTTVFGIAGGYFFGLTGFVVIFAGCHLILLAILLATACPLNWHHYRQELSLRLIRSGFPIMGTRFMLMVLYNADQIMIWLMLSRAELGLYSMQTYLLTIVLLVPTVVSAVLYPRIMEAVGKSERPEQLSRYLVQPTLIMAWLACLVIGLIFILLPLPIKWLLPAYVPSIQPGRILLLAAFFRVIAGMPTILHISLRQERRLIHISLLAIIFTLTAVGLLIANGYGLTGVAIGTVMGFILYAQITMASAMHMVGMSMRRMIGFVMHTLGPCFLMVLLLGGVFYGIPEQTDPGGTALKHTLFRCIVFGIPMLALCAVRCLHRPKWLERYR
jgi:O-antigen/teichoic acid export membrane protein